MPHIPADRNHKNARIPHLLGTQRAANKVINPHQSPTYPGVGGGGGGSGFTLTGALRLACSLRFCISIPYLLDRAIVETDFIL